MLLLHLKVIYAPTRCSDISPPVLSIVLAFIHGNCLYDYSVSPFNFVICEDRDLQAMTCHLGPSSVLGIGEIANKFH